MIVLDEGKSTPVWNGRRLFQNGIDDAAESQRTLTDHSSLANPLVLGTRSTYILRTRKFNKVEFQVPGLKSSPIAGTSFLDVHINRKDRVGAARMVIEFGGGDLAAVTAFDEES